MIPYRRFRGWRRRLLLGGGVVGALLVVAVVALIVAYPRLGARKLRDDVVPRLAQRLGRAVTVDAIDVSFGRAVLRGVTVAGLDAALPLAKVDRIEVTFAVLPSLWGRADLDTVTVDGVALRARRRADGTDDVRDVVARLRGSGGARRGAAGPRPRRLEVHGISVEASDERDRVTATAGNGDAVWLPGRPATLTLRDVAVRTQAGPRGEAAVVTIERAPGATPLVRIEGGAATPWQGLSLTDIAGTLTPTVDGGRYALDLEGGYGGAGASLWTARGHVAPQAGTADVALVAQAFQLDRLAPILGGTPVIDPERTTIDADLSVQVTPKAATFRGGFHVTDLSVTHALVADKPVRALDFSGDVEGSLDRATKTVQLTRGDFITAEVPFSLTGNVTAGALRAVERAVRQRRHGEPGDHDAAPSPAPTDPTARLDLRLTVPPVACQRVLDAIPKEAAPYLAGYQLSGTYAADLHLAIDWADLDATVLDGIDSRLGLGGCRVERAPQDSPRRLLGEFEHFVEVERGQWLSIWVGDGNPEFVPLARVSPYLTRSLMTTEDSAFGSHHGFIVREFRTALISNLRAGHFRHGASSISMQLVKNVLLYREKTLARKLQELFLTWDLENVLSKDRILEIYVNVIEYGPGIYGIGPAAQHYFGKSASDLTPTEAAFFSSILPNPKERYAQYCAGTLRRQTEAKIGRILDLMLKRGRLTEEEHALAKATPLAFARGDDHDVGACMGRRSRALRNARSTNPLKK